MLKEMIRMACPACRSENLSETASKAARSLLPKGKSSVWMLVPAALAVGFLGGLYYFRADVKRYVKMSRM